MQREKKKTSTFSLIIFKTNIRINSVGSMEKLGFPGGSVVKNSPAKQEMWV